MKDEELDKKEILKTCSVELVCLAMSMAARSVEKLFNRKIKASGSTMSEIYALYGICEYRGESISYIAEKLQMDRSTLTRKIERMGKYVSLHRDKADRRYAYPALTPAGAEFLKKWMPKVLEIEQGVGILVGDKENFIKFIKTLSSDIVNSKINVEDLK